jgi:anti-sigma B factor antagonist
VRNSLSIHVMTEVSRVRAAIAARKPETDMEPFHLQSIAAGRDCAVLQITGEVDVYTAPRLREHVMQLVSGGVRHIVADLRGVDFLDSTGLGALVGSLKRLRTHGGSLKLAASPGPTLRIFQITGLTRAFAVYPSVLDAITTDERWHAAVTDDGLDTDEWCRKHGLL